MGCLSFKCCCRCCRKSASSQVRRKQGQLLKALVQDTSPGDAGLWVSCDGSYCYKNRCTTLEQYMSTLELDGSLTREQIGVAFLEAYAGRRFAVLADVLVLPMLPKTLRTESASSGLPCGVDPMTAMGWVSMLATSEERSAVQLFSAGGSPGQSSWNQDVALCFESFVSEGIFNFPTDIDKVVDRIPWSQGAESLKYSQPCPAVLPDLCKGRGFPGRGARDAAKYQVAAAVFNRLAANGLIHAGRQSGQVFSVRVGDSDTLLTTVGEVLMAVAATKAELQIAFISQVSTFGVEFCVREKTQERDLHLPMVGSFAAETGLVDSNGRSIRTLVTHCGLQITLSDFAVQGYLGVEGFAGWFPAADRPPWHEAAVEHPHAQLKIAEGARAADLLCAAACAANACADQNGLRAGGYGTLGVCNTFTGLIELALLGKTTIPFLLGRGVGQQMLYALCLQLEKQLADNQADNWASWLVQVRKAIQQLPDDVQVLVRDAQSAADRNYNFLKRLRDAGTPFTAFINYTLAQLENREHYLQKPSATAAGNLPGLTTELPGFCADPEHQET